MPAATAAKLIVDALLQRFLPLARRRIDTAQAQDGQYLRASDAAYEQVLDSLAMVARHTPIPLLEALLKWRESESPKGANDASTFQRKLAVECIFCSACIRFVECCPQEGLTETLWNGLENFVFDWLINADRVVSQTDYPSLFDLRGLLLDLVAQLLGALSRIRFSSITERFFNELNTRRIDTNVTRSETLSIIHGMRYLKLGVSSLGGLNASTSFVAKANPLNRMPAKKKSELHHALCNMLSSVLAPLTDGGSGQWPPAGVDQALTLWYDAVLRIRNQLMHWMERQSKHVNVGYPLVTSLLCLGDPEYFISSFNPHLDQLYKLLREKNNRSVALECLHRVLRFYLNVYAESQPQNRVWMTLHSVTAQLLSCLKKGFFTLDVQHEKLVDLCVTIAESNLDFAMNHVILELLRTENLSEAKVIGLRGLLAIVSSTSAEQRTDDSRLSLTSFRGSPTSSWSSATSAVFTSSRHSAAARVDIPSSTHDIGPYIPKVRAALGSIIKACHSTYGGALLTSSKATLDALSKEKPQGWLVFRWALKCVPHLIPEQWRNDRMTEIIPVYAISVEPGVREEAVQVLFRTVRDLPQSRFAVMRGMANFIFRLPDDFPILIRISLDRLVQLLSSWRVSLLEELSDSKDNYNKSSRHAAPSEARFHPSGLDAVGLIFLCSVDVQIRHTALELLRAVRALYNDLSRMSSKEKNNKRPHPDHTYVIDVFEEAGDDIVQQCYWDCGRWYEMRKEWDAIPPELSLQTVLESSDKGRWGRCLSELVKYAAELCPSAVQGARLEVVQRLAQITSVELGGKSTTSHDDSKLDQWLLYSMFACSCPPEDVEDTKSHSTKELLRLILPSLKSGSETQIVSLPSLDHSDAYLYLCSFPPQNAATLALGHCHWEICEPMLTELRQFLDEIATEIESRPKWKSQKLRREDIRVHVANIYRMVADNFWPGMLIRKPVQRIHVIKFIEDTVKYITSPSPLEVFQDLQPLRFCLGSVLRSVSIEMVKSNSDRFDPRTRKRMFDLLASWCDDTTTVWSQDGVSEYRREVERYKSSQNSRTKDSVERITVEKDVNEQVDAIQWIAMNAMAALLYGPCFDDNVRKMSGRIIAWINGLFLEPATRMPIGYSPDPRTPLHKFAMAGVFDVVHGGKDRHKSNPMRVHLAKVALMNLVQTNLDLFPACIDQCYSSDPSIADGYFSVLAEVYMRYEIPRCDTQRLLSLILYKVVDQSRRIRDDALQMLETLSIREWAEDGEGTGRYRAAVVGSLPDSYQQFQYQLSAKLAKEHPELSELLCEEIMQRQLDAVDIIAQHQVLTCMAPWIENLKLWESGWSERLLKSLYYVTWRHGDQFPDEIEKLWRTVANKRRNISPVLDFLISKGIEDGDSTASGEITGVFATYFSVAKRISLYLARISPQQTIDNLVCELAERRLEDHPEQSKRSVDGAFELESSAVLEFSQGPAPVQLLEPPPHMSPLLVRSSLEGPLRNASGSLSWRTATGRSMSGPLNTVPDTHTGRSGQLFTGSGPLPNASGQLLGVRSSTGSLKSHHLSRDSGDYFDTPNSVEDIRIITPPVNPSELQSALQAHHHWLSRADIALILLAEIAYENDEDFRSHLPLLFHVTFVYMDSSEDIVLKHCQQLLVNLLYSLAGRHLELYEHGDGDYKQQVVSLIKYVQSKKGSRMWEKESMSLTRTELPSAALLSALVLSVVDAIVFQGDLREKWGEEALKWAMECSYRHLACRSHQVYRALRPSVTSETCVSLLRCLHRCFSNPTPPVLGFVMEILLTLQVMVESMEPEKVILYPQLFWGCVAMLHTDFVHVYVQVLELLSRIVDRLSFHDHTAEQVLLSSMPRDEFESSEGKGDGGTDADKAPAFEGVQPLVLKGLMSTVSHTCAIEVLSRITLHSCDRIFGDSDTRLLMHIVGLLPWLLLQLVKGQSHLPGFDSPLQQQFQKACSVATNIAQWCEAKSQGALAAVFSAYGNGQVTAIGDLLNRIVPLLCKEWFPRHSALAFGHLLRVLEKGPVEYQRVILLMLRALLQHCPMDTAQSPQVYAAVSQLVESPLCWEALHVLEAVLQSCSTLPVEATTSSGQDATANGQAATRRLDEDRPVVALLSQTSFKSRTGPFHSWVGSGGVPAVTGNPGSVDMTMLPSRETALQNTRLALGRVLDTYGVGKRSYYRRLVPFVISSVQAEPQQKHR
ncbi:cell morphogenesis protein PAG1 isoform X1 [Selaginella moellendorffii]|uniref:cell morphogenesis protein PAG1 isoform X1 n=1 Tax=Selaginella moellendorffii TaxID=88036 RepID=UPI000D1C48F9|nr:cell morphogenesis protein PAG1 isoform X1 [Selaginella moellendorffii]XP_024526382.1 cell morphogenesis protein PAG1 isoform X1 [Selaginella moellendorffii]XP_024526383.1 cell morphogenesis protein PAG1 isoform X1 [Selaginella moellendorffii]|eukprot:XP_024526381.1 cell morphogenesis protein PAG1 isoform X1 [Selaginella moellendorffii]